MTTSTDTGEANELSAFDTEDSAIDAIFAHLSEKKDEDAERPSDDEGEEETSESTQGDDEDGSEKSDESPDDEGSDEDAEGDDKDDQSSKKYAEDDVFFKVKVGEEEIEVSAKDLKRLYGQEAALTRRSQEVAAQRQAIEAEQQAYATRTTALLQRATSKADQFRQIPWLALTKDPNVPADQLQTLQQMAQQAFEEEAFLQQETNALVQHAQQTAHTNQVRQAAESVKVLSDQASPMYIEGFNQKTYGDMVKFAIDKGVPANIATQIVDAPTLKLLHMAMQFDKGSKRTVTQRVNKTPKKIVKTSQAPQTVGQTTKQAQAKKAMTRLAKTGSEDDAIAAIMARMGGGDED